MKGDFIIFMICEICEIKDFIIEMNYMNSFNQDKKVVMAKSFHVSVFFKYNLVKEVHTITSRKVNKSHPTLLNLTKLWRKIPDPNEFGKIRK